MKIEGTRAAVTGAATGIGRGIALALAEKGAAFVAIADLDLDAAERTATEVRARGAQTIAISTVGNERAAEVADETIEVARTDWILQPIVAILPLQLLAYDIARALGLNVDQPRNLAKTVTVE